MSHLDMVPRRRGTRWLWAALLAALSSTIAFASPQADQSAPDLQPIKDYTLNQARLMQTATERLNQMAADYEALLGRHGGNYQAAWKAEPAALRNLLVAGRAAWVDASTFYELSEGIIAGVPSLAFYDTWIDAGPSGAEDPAEAIDWTLEVADGRVLDKPGNLFHHLTEPVLWGTVDEWTGARVDLDGDGQIAAVADALPETAILMAVSGAIDGAAAEMAEAVTAWAPTLPDVFTALVVMVPTMNEYFEQWKESRYVAGGASTEISFVAVSRLFDINGILAGLDPCLRPRLTAGRRCRCRPGLPHRGGVHAARRLRQRSLRGGAGRTPVHGGRGGPVRHRGAGACHDAVGAPGPRRGVARGQAGPGIATDPRATAVRRRRP